MTGKLNSILYVLAFVLALAMAPMSVAFADGGLGLVFDVLDDSDSEEGSILELEEAEDSDSEDVDSEDSDSEDSDSEDSDSEDSDDDLDDSDSEDDSEEDMIEE
ncbi:MAG: hypothetical protein IID58_10280 [Proteobacteria bacterium]|nr:hypothetical protein [Pseudomonadota bacterium]